MNDSKCEDMIGWPHKCKPISLAYSTIQVFDRPRQFYLSNIQDMRDEGRQSI